MRAQVGASIKNWYNNLQDSEKIKYLERFDGVMIIRGFTIVSKNGTKSQYELPHEHETDHERRKRERKEQKITNKLWAKFIGEEYEKILRTKNDSKPM